MKTLAKSIMVLLLSATMVVAGVFAATQSTQSTTGSVSFSSTDVYMDIAGTSTLAEEEANKEYTGKTYTDFTTAGTADADAWTIGAINLNSTTNTVTITFTFTNKGDQVSTVAITAPTLSDSFSVVATAKEGEAAAATYTSEALIELAYDETVTFTYVITLAAYNKTVEAADFSFAVVMAPKAAA